MLDCYFAPTIRHLRSQLIFKIPWVKIKNLRSCGNFSQICLNICVNDQDKKTIKNVELFHLKAPAQFKRSSHNIFFMPV